MQSKFIVTDMHCDHCVMRISNALKKINGVEKVEANLSTKEVNVSHGDLVSRSQMAKAIEQVGYSIS
jgi:copper chaperone